MMMMRITNINLYIDDEEAINILQMTRYPIFRALTEALRPGTEDMRQEKQRIEEGEESKLVGRVRKKEKGNSWAEE